MAREPMQILLELLPRPETPSPTIDWAAFSQAIGISLPADYRRFCELWGRVRVDDQLNVEAPTNRAVDGLGAFVRWKLAIDRDLREDGQWQGPLWPERDGLFPWGWFDDGTTLLWRTSGKPDSWPVVLRRDDEEVEDCGQLTDTGVSAVAFLAERLARSPNERPLELEPLGAVWSSLGEADAVDSGAQREGDRWRIYLELADVLGEPGESALDAFLRDLDARHPRLRERIVEATARHSREELIVSGRWLGNRRSRLIRDAATRFAKRRLQDVG